MARDERAAEEANARLGSLLRAVSSARSLTRLSPATTPADMNAYLQQAFPTFRGGQQLQQEQHPLGLPSLPSQEPGPSTNMATPRNVMPSRRPTPKSCSKKGTEREGLFSSGFVLSSFNLNTTENEDTIRNKLEEGFKDVLHGISSFRKFEFVRAVERSIVPIKIASELNGRAIYSIAGQRERPIYIQACEDISWRVNSDSHIFDSGSEADESTDEILSTTTFTVDSQVQRENEIDVGSAEDKQECPFCHNSFPTSVLAAHANSCIDLVNISTSMVAGESTDSVVHDLLTSVLPDKKELPQSLEDCLRMREKEFVALKKTAVAVRIKKAYSDAVQKFKLFFDKAPLGPISIEFIGEVAVDDGGPLREFFTIIFESAPGHVLTGNENNYTLCHDAHKLERKEYEIYGKFVAASLLQGGPGPHNWCRPLTQYVLGIEPKIVLEDIPDYEVQQKLLHIQRCTNEEEFSVLIDALDERFDAGYNKPIVSSKEGRVEGRRGRGRRRLSMMDDVLQGRDFHSTKTEAMDRSKWRQTVLAGPAQGQNT
eukprot:gene1841-2071_t